jgi:broad specificity phosphatase PhoE
MRQENLPRVYIARHCSTKYNDEHRVQGNLDIPLSDAGRVQARTNARSIMRLGVSRIVSSPLRRAFETAKIYAQQSGATLSTDPRLRELDHGSWQGRVIDELLSDPNNSFGRWLEDPMSVGIPDGSESLGTAQRRIVGAIRDAALKSEGAILIVTHKHIRAILQCALLDIGLTQFKDQIDESIEPAEVPAYQIRRIVEDESWA